MSNMNTMYLEFELQKQTLIRRDSFRPVAYSDNYLKARFKFSNDWVNTTKRAIFSWNNYSYIVTLDENDECSIPRDVIKPNNFFVSVKGEINDEIVLITSNRIGIGVTDTGIIGTEAPIRYVNSNTLSHKKDGDVIQLEIPNNYGTKLELNKSIGVISLIGNDGNVINSIDLYTERIITNIYYDSLTSEIVFEFENHSPIRVNIGDVFELDDYYTKTEMDSFLVNLKKELNDNISETKQALENQINYNYEELNNNIENSKLLLDAKIENNTTNIADNISKIQKNSNDINANTNNIASNSNSINSINEKINSIQELIPQQATSENQLADKDYVNSSIATSTATFRGTFNSTLDFPLVNVDDNDYIFLDTTDELGNRKFDRYKYSEDDGQWHYEYTLNNSSFTAEQWKAINSGLTKEQLNGILTSLNDIISRAFLKSVATTTYPRLPYIRPNTTNQEFIEFSNENKSNTLAKRDGANRIQAGSVDLSDADNTANDAYLVNNKLLREYVSSKAFTKPTNTAVYNRIPVIDSNGSQNMYRFTSANVGGSAVGRDAAGRTLIGSVLLSEAENDIDGAYAVNVRLLREYVATKTTPKATKIKAKLDTTDYLYDKLKIDLLNADSDIISTTEVKLKKSELKYSTFIFNEDDDVPTMKGDCAGTTSMEERLERYPFNELYMEKVQLQDSSGGNLDGTDTFLVMPNLWYESKIHGDSKGWTITFANKKVNSNFKRMYESDEITELLLARYKAIKVGNYARSKSGDYPLVNTKQTTFDSYLPYYNGQKIDSNDYRNRILYSMLFVCFTGHRNSQNAYRGIVDYVWGNGTTSQYGESLKNGTTDVLGDGLVTGEITEFGGNALANGKRPFSVLGVENPYGAVWENVTGITHNASGELYAYEGFEHMTPSMMDPTDSNTYYTNTGITLSTANEGWQKTFAIHNGYPFPISVGGSSSANVGDYYWFSAGWRIFFVGGCFNNSSLAGLFSLNGDNGFGHSYLQFCFRLSLKR